MRLSRVVLGSAVLLGAMVAVSPTTATAVNDNASCVGVLASFFAQEEFAPGPGLSAEVKVLQELAADCGVPLGALVSLLAQENGTVDECLSLLDDCPGAE